MVEATNLSSNETAPPPEQPAFGLDQSGMIEMQQRQIDAFGRASAIISATVSAVISKQFDLLQKEAEQIADEMKLLFDVRNPAEVVPKQVAAARNNFDQTLADLREINDIARKGTFELLDVLRQMPPSQPAPAAEARKPSTRSVRAA